MRYAPVVLLVFALGPPAALAQVVRGEVVEAGSRGPVAGAMVVLAEDGGAPVRRVLTDASGGFVLQAPHPGPYVLRVDRIGYASLTTETFDVPVQGTSRSVEVPVRPIELAGLDVSGARRCEVRPEEGRVTAQVWEEARKALQAAAWTQESGVYRYTLLHYVRDLDRDGREIESEERTFSRGSTRTPFVSLPAEELVESGFVQQEGDTVVVYHAPDADAFLSDGFLDTHCLGVRRGDGGLMGLTFQPVAERTLPDIEGVLWLDEQTALLRRLEFTYVNLDRRTSLGEAGGEVVFTALPNGTWIVREFRIRMPTLTTGGRGTRRVGYRDEGGLAWRITDRTGEIVLEATTATISGTVVDSTGARPLSDALVRTVEAGDERRTRPDGSFTLPSLPPGLHTLSVRHPALDSLGLVAPPVRVEAELGEIVPVTVRVPSFAELLRTACAVDGTAPEGAILLGRIHHPTGSTPQGVAVTIAWLPDRGRSAPPLAAPQQPGEEPLLWRHGTEGAYETLQTTTDRRGIFMLCGARGGSWYRVRAARAGGIAASRWVRIPRGADVVPVTLTIPEGGGG